MQGQSFLIFKFVGKLYPDTGAVSLEQSGLFNLAVSLSRFFCIYIDKEEK